MSSTAFLKNVRPLSRDEIIARAPAAAATGMAPGRVDDTYDFLPSMEVVDALAEHGWDCVMAAQSNTRSMLAPWAKHMLRFRSRRSELLRTSGRSKLGDLYPELVFINAHDGSSKAKAMKGIFRMICSNGMIVSEGETSDFNIRHQGFTVEELLQQVYNLIDERDEMLEEIIQFRDIQLTQQQRIDFAIEAASARWPVASEAPFPAPRLLEVRRDEDKGNDLWHVLNRVQENLVVGGQEVRRKTKTGKTRRSTIRPANSVDLVTRINTGVWETARNYALRLAA